MPLAAELDPDTYGGAMLLGVDGVCIISHGSSSARAIVNAVRVADHAVGEGLVDQLRAAIAVPVRSPAYRFEPAPATRHGALSAGRWRWRLRREARRRSRRDPDGRR